MQTLRGIIFSTLLATTIELSVELEILFLSA